VSTAAFTSLLDGTYRASQEAVTGIDSTGKPIITQTHSGPTIKDQGWTVVGRPDNYTGDKATKTGLQLLEDAVANFDPETQQLMGIYGEKGQGGNLPWRTADNDYSATGTGSYSNNSNINASNTALTGDALAAELKTTPTVAQLTGQALKAFGKDKDGFWLMVEVGDIDWAAHADNMDLMLGTLHDMDDVVNTVTSWVKTNGGWENNQVIVTADHDHHWPFYPTSLKRLRNQSWPAKLETTSKLQE
jgi:alkaline phosphatase